MIVTKSGEPDWPVLPHYLSGHVLSRVRFVNEIGCKKLNARARVTL
jgi:hypothetical protein